MKGSILAIAAIFVLGGCSDDASLADSSDNFIQYKVGGNQYSVVYVQTDDTSSGEAKDLAMKKAAQVTKSNGYRYFVVDSVDDVKVAYTPPGNENQQFHQNLYQEMIVEGDFGPNSDASKQANAPRSSLYPGVKVTFSCYKEEPSGSSVDACDLTNCD